MKSVFEVIQRNPLFSGISIDDFDHILACMNAKVSRFCAGQVILIVGDPISAVGLILHGSVQIMREDANGNHRILTELSASEFFGETFACAGIDHSPVTVQAAESCEILFLDYQKMISICTAACAFHSRLIANMLTLLARKNLFLNQKIEILSRRTTRERLLLFFEMQRGTTRKFSIPYNREELAAFLCVDRSAMSAELSRMQRDGLIRFRKNQFELL